MPFGKVARSKAVFDNETTENKLGVARAWNALRQQNSFCSGNEDSFIAQKSGRVFGIGCMIWLNSVENYQACKNTEACKKLLHPACKFHRKNSPSYGCVSYEFFAIKVTKTKIMNF